MRNATAPQKCLIFAGELIFTTTTTTLTAPPPPPPIYHLDNSKLVEPTLVTVSTIRLVLTGLRPLHSARISRPIRLLSYRPIYLDPLTATTPISHCTFTTTSSPSGSSATTKMSFPELDALFESNKQWAAAVRDKEPEFFPTQAKGQVRLALFVLLGDMFDVG